MTHIANIVPNSDHQGARNASASDRAPPLQQYLTYRLSRVQAKLNAQTTRMLHEVSGITLMQWRIIALIGAAGQTRLSDMAKNAALDKGLLSRNLKAMIKEGLVIAGPDTADRRVQVLSLSPQGAEVFARTMPASRLRQQQLQAMLTDEELQVFGQVLEKLERAAELVIPTQHEAAP